MDSNHRVLFAHLSQPDVSVSGRDHDDPRRIPDAALRQNGLLVSAIEMKTIDDVQRVLDTAAAAEVPVGRDGPAWSFPFVLIGTGHVNAQRSLVVADLSSVCGSDAACPSWTPLCTRMHRCSQSFPFALQNMQPALQLARQIVQQRLADMEATGPTTREARAPLAAVPFESQMDASGRMVCLRVYNHVLIDARATTATAHLPPLPVSEIPKVAGFRSADVEAVDSAKRTRPDGPSDSDLYGGSADVVNVNPFVVGAAVLLAVSALVGVMAIWYVLSSRSSPVRRSLWAAPYAAKDSGLYSAFSPSAE